MEDLIIYTDGGCRNHGNHKNDHVYPTDPSAWAFLVHNQNTNQTITKNQASFGHTNNQMELTAVTEALLYVYQNFDHYDKLNIRLIIDSRYVFNPLTKNWLNNWVQNDWQNSQNKPVKNLSYWQRFFKIYQQFDLNQFSWTWTKGHAANQGNIIVDQLVNDAMDNLTLTPKP